MARAITTAIGWTADSGRPSAARGPSITCATAGSATTPSETDATVIPSCAQASISETCSIAHRAVRARADPAAASGSMALRRAETTANSALTKTAFAASSARPRSAATPALTRSPRSTARESRDDRPSPRPGAGGRPGGRRHAPGRGDGRSSRDSRAVDRGDRVSAGVAALLGLALLAANAFFVGAEFAVVSARRSAIEPLAAAGSARARTALWAMEHVSLMLACAQLGITVASVSLGVVAEPAVAQVIEGPLAALGLPESAVHPIAVVIALAVVVYLHVVLGEMVPKNLAVAGPDRAALWFAPPLVWVARTVSPVITALNWLANHAVRLLGLEPKNEVASAFTVEEVQSIVERSQAEGLLHDTQGLLAGAI